ncbi:DNA glycosylase AlkZ-like family protein [Arthrobacter sp. LjRoot14]|uniref:DNA glycosylase AlkZ-like family protein n=1 Tax=Arthrobacter sp. LjRoot14 TaxID=3342265 RepID=UPI003F4F4FAB
MHADDVVGLRLSRQQLRPPRAHILRPTWHFVPRDDLRWLLMLSAPRLHRGNAGRYRQAGIDADWPPRSNAGAGPGVKLKGHF